MFTLRAFVLAVSLFILCQTAVVAGEGWDYWNEFQLKTPLKEKTNLRLKTEQRSRNDFDEHYLTNFELGLIFKQNKHFEFGALYKYEDEKSTSGKRTYENRFSIEGTFNWKIRDLSFGNRHRFNYRNVSGNYSWRYRFKLKASYPVKTNGFMLTTYMADEVFYDNVPGKINQNRLSAGFSKRLTGNLKLEIYYMLKSKLKSGGWSDINVLGTTFSISF